ncbi:MAG: translation initiation factor IF-2 subunit beta [Candidatus ainarchaeum sp.]|nr:translation initiation factor IF-2 subunit beta [Candidatus ainarchaeum sp.]MDD3975697.1 translation initiation factor IF-2 subunit beta [Candidatus ainarchaeum sp.]
MNDTKNELNYKDLLDRIYMSLPNKALDDSRFILPTVESMVMGKQTIWKNFSKVAKTIKRDESQIYKFIMKEISTSSSIQNGTLILNGVFNNYKLNQIFEKYLKNFVICLACKKPDTDIVTQNGVKVLKCSVCGAINPLPKL